MSRVLTGLRSSELARCPRQCALRGLFPPEPDDPDTPRARQLVRGQVFGWVVYEQFKAKYGKDDVRRELEIPWGENEDWVAHCDIAVWSQRLLVEVVSSGARMPSVDAKVRQVQQYLHWAQAQNFPFSRAGVYVVNPLDLDRDEYIPVVLDGERRAEIDADVRAVERALAGAELPACRGSSPRECREQLYCQFTDLAWPDWQPPEAVDLGENTEAVVLAENLALVAEHRRLLKAQDEADAQEEREMREQLLALGVEPGLEYELGDVRLRVTEVAGRETFSLARARKTGVWRPADDERFAACVHKGEPSQRWTITETVAL